MSGGLTEENTLPAWVKERCDYVVELKDNYDFIIVSSRYSFNTVTKRDEHGKLVYENKKISDCLIKNNIKRDKIILESSSVESIGGVVFSLDLIRKLYDFKNIQSIEFVTSSFHKERVELISQHISKIFRFRNILKTSGIPSSEDGVNRLVREKKSIKRYKDEWLHLTNEKDIWKKLFQSHECYNLEQSSSFEAGPKFLY